MSEQKLTSKSTQPEFLSSAKELTARLRKLSPVEIARLMTISDKLAQQTFERCKDWKAKHTPSNSKQAILAYQGDVYIGLAADEFGHRDFAYAQRHLRILSGLYGLLRPLDLIQSYRLEMGIKLDNARGNSLYAFWGKRITEAIEAVLGEQQNPVLINLASNEYFKAIKANELGADVVTPVFKDEKDGTFRVMSFFAKKARGQLASYMIHNNLDDPAGLKDFREGGYRFNKKLSTGEQFVFTRKEKARKQA